MIERENPGAFPVNRAAGKNYRRAPSWTGVSDGRRYRVVQGEICASKLTGQVGRKGKTEGDAV